MYIIQNVKANHTIIFLVTFLSSKAVTWLIYKPYKIILVLQFQEGAEPQACFLTNESQLIANYHKNKLTHLFYILLYCDLHLSYISLIAKYSLSPHLGSGYFISYNYMIGHYLEMQLIQ